MTVDGDVRAGSDEGLESLQKFSLRVFPQDIKCPRMEGGVELSVP